MLQVISRYVCDAIPFFRGRHEGKIPAQYMGESDSVGCWFFRSK